MGEAGGGTGQSLRNIKPIYPAGQRIILVLLKSIRMEQRGLTLASIHYCIT